MWKRHKELEKDNRLYHLSRERERGIAERDAGKG
jgi:hypothetical protein